jgi:hypothetical protein
MVSSNAALFLDWSKFTLNHPAMNAEINLASLA